MAPSALSSRPTSPPWGKGAHTQGPRYTAHRSFACYTRSCDESNRNKLKPQSLSSPLLVPCLQHHASPRAQQGNQRAKGGRSLCQQLAQSICVVASLLRPCVEGTGNFKAWRRASGFPAEEHYALQPCGVHRPTCPGRVPSPTHLCTTGKDHQH